jgi:hypothetical protein
MHFDMGRFLIFSLTLGYIVLFTAIVLNMVASKLKWATWYHFLQDVTSFGFGSSFSSLRLIDIVFLFILYPVSLGAAAYFTYRLLERFFQ